MKACDIMTSPVITVTPQTRVQEIARIMAEEEISGVVVVDEEGLAVGVVSEWDLIHRVAHPHLPPHVQILGSVIFLDPRRLEELKRKILGITAADVMNEALVWASPETEVADLADRMVEHKVHRVIILDEEGRPVGIVTRGDLVRRVLARPAEPAG